MSEQGRPGTALAAGSLDPRVYATDPHPLYARLRAEAPVAWNEARGFWALSRTATFGRRNDHETYCAGRGILVDEIGPPTPRRPP